MRRYAKGALGAFSPVTQPVHLLFSPADGSQPSAVSRLFVRQDTEL